MADEIDRVLASKILGNAIAFLDDTARCYEATTQSGYHIDYDDAAAVEFLEVKREELWLGEPHSHTSDAAAYRCGCYE